MNGGRTKIIYYLSDNSTKTFVVPSTVTEISPYAFASILNFWEVIIPNGALTKIGFSAFMYCSNLRRIVFPDSLQIIDHDAFLNCNKLLCGGVIMKESLIPQAKEAGINEKVLSYGCINNYDALIRKPTCKLSNHFIILRNILTFIFVYI